MPVAKTKVLISFAVTAKLTCYTCRENKGADQLCSKCEADLHICFGIGENPVFSHDAAHMYGKTKHQHDK